MQNLEVSAIIENLLLDTDPCIRAALAENCNLPLNMYLKLYTDADPVVCRAAGYTINKIIASRTDVTIEFLLNLCTHNNFGPVKRWIDKQARTNPEFVFPPAIRSAMHPGDAKNTELVIRRIKEENK